MNRRSFFNIALTTIGTLIFYSRLGHAEERKRGGGHSATVQLKLIDPSEPGARAVNYVHDTKNIKDSKLQTDRAGVKFKNQHCKVCAFYENDNETKINGKNAASCKMPFATGKLVSAEGWCTSWAKK